MHKPRTTSRKRKRERGGSDVIKIKKKPNFTFFLFDGRIQHKTPFLFPSLFGKKLS
jgi:hypothetical protein